MTAPAQPVFRLRILFAIALVFLCCPFSLHAQPECSLSKTNKSCRLVIDRSNPVAPSTIQMYSDQQLTVVIENPLPFERYFLDFTTGQATVAPDVAGNIVSSLTSNLGKLSNVIQSREYIAAFNLTTAAPEATDPLKGCYAANFADQQWPVHTHVIPARPDFHNCFGALAGYAITTYRELEPLVAPDSLTSTSLTSSSLAYLTRQAYIQNRIDRYVAAESAISNTISTLVKPPSSPSPAYSDDEQTFITTLGVYQKIIDAVSADLAGYEQRIKDIGRCGYSDSNPHISDPFCWHADIHDYALGDLAVLNRDFYIRSNNDACTEDGNGSCVTPDRDDGQWAHVLARNIKYLGDFDRTKKYSGGNQVTDHGVWWTCLDTCDPLAKPTTPTWIQSRITLRPAPAVVIQSRNDDHHIYENMVTRAITYSLDELNLVSYAQESAATSTNKKAIAPIAINFADRHTKGPGVPYTALRWEASAGVFFSWLPNRTFTEPSIGTVQESKTRPTPIPFAAANYRLTGDFGNRWKQNIYATAAVGINPNNTTAEFGVGPSYAWRSFMVSALCHIGHDTRPTLPLPTSATTSALPTTSHWTEAFAIGISVRVPSLTGR